MLKQLHFILEDCVGEGIVLPDWSLMALSAQ